MLVLFLTAETHVFCQTFKTTFLVTVKTPLKNRTKYHHGETVEAPFFHREITVETPLFIYRQNNFLL